MKTACALTQAGTPLRYAPHYHTSLEPVYLHDGGSTALIGQLLPLLTLSPVPIHNNNTTRDLLRYCASHYREPLTLTTVAATLHIHPNTVSAIFNRNLHATFTEYINSLRIEEACKLLPTSTDSITNIASAVGFASIRTFNRVFLNLRGMTPRAYRETKAEK